LEKLEGNLTGIRDQIKDGYILIEKKGLFY